jgi:hypothetical protein
MVIKAHNNKSLIAQSNATKLGETRSRLVQAKLEQKGTLGVDAAASFEQAKPVYTAKLSKTPTSVDELRELIHHALGRKWGMAVADSSAKEVTLKTASPTSSGSWSANFGTRTFNGLFEPSTNKIDVLATNSPDRTHAQPEHASVKLPFSVKPIVRPAAEIPESFFKLAGPEWSGSGWRDYPTTVPPIELAHRGVRYDVERLPEDTADKQRLVHMVLGRAFKGVADNLFTRVNLPEADTAGIHRWTADYNGLTFSGTLASATGEVTVLTAGRRDK